VARKKTKGPTARELAQQKRELNFAIEIEDQAVALIRLALCIEENSLSEHEQHLTWLDMRIGLLEKIRNRFAKFVSS
jgi:hypothetical protein